MGHPLQKFKVDGGASANDFLLEFQAGIMNMPVYRPQCIETTSLGAAYLAGLATGYWKNRDDILSNWQIDRIFKPDMDQRKESGTVGRLAQSCALHVWMGQIAAGGHAFARTISREPFSNERKASFCLNSLLTPRGNVRVSVWF